MGSTRLPGKVLAEVAGRALLAHHLGRLQRCRRLDAVVLATTERPEDDLVAALGAQLGVGVFRGAAEDVLDRYARCAAAFEAEVIVRVTADCPLIDPGLVDALVALFLDQAPPVDYAAIDISRFPRGLDAEVFGRASLEEAAARAGRADEREHVTRYFQRRPERFTRRFLTRPANDGEPFDNGSLRWCVDEPVDLELIRRMLETLLPATPTFGWRDCLALLAAHPDWAALNRGVVQKT